MNLDYISILASGSCPCNCEFCIGNKTRVEEKPHFASCEDIWSFLRDTDRKVTELSISGSTTDPLYVDEKMVLRTIEVANDFDYNVSVHTHVFNELTKRVCDMVDELCVSINNKQDMYNFLALDVDICKVRVSTVVTSKSLEWLNTGEIFNIGASKYTFRKNVYEPTIDFPKVSGKVVGNLFGNDLIQHNKATAAFWNYSNTNKKANAEYLWANGEIHNQEYWEDFK